MDYKDLLDFKKQSIVDEVYKRYKNEEVNEDLDQAYQQISERNQTKIQTLQYKVDNINNKISQFIGMLGMLIFAILFILCGSLLISTLSMWLHYYVAKDILLGLKEWMYQWGMKVYDVLISSSIGLSSVEALKSDPMMIQMFYILGLTVILIIFFIGLFIYFQIKPKKKEQIQSEETKISIEEDDNKKLENSYRRLEVDEDDDWSYIRSQLERKLKRKNKDFFNHYYAAYIYLFDHFQPVEGSFDQLQTSQKVKLCIRTFLNTSKNILGTLSKPIFFSLVIMWTFYRMFVESASQSWSFEILLSGSKLGSFILLLMDKSYQFVMATPLKIGLLPFVESVELLKMLSLCVVISLIYVLYMIFNYRMRESIRQFHRRMNYELKKNQGIYKEDKKLSKAYHYSLDFTVFVVIVCLFCGYNYYLSQRSEDVSATALKAYQNSEKLVITIAKGAGYKNTKSERKRDYPFDLMIKDYGKEGKEGYLKEVETDNLINYQPAYGLSYRIVYMINEDYAKEEYFSVRGHYSFANNIHEEEIKNGIVNIYLDIDGQYVYFVIRQGSMIYELSGEVKDLKKMQKFFNKVNIDYKVPTLKELKEK